MSRSGNVTAGEAAAGRAPLEQTVAARRAEFGEILRPLTLAADATETGDGLRVSRLDASKAPNLATVGRGIHCRELILAGTAIATLPDDVQVVQRLDVSACSRLERLPDNLKVGQLVARDCVALAALPAGLCVSYLDLTGCTALAALPADLVIRKGRLSLRGCVRLAALPPGIGPLAQLDLSGCLNITAVPPRSRSRPGSTSAARASRRCRRTLPGLRSAGAACRSTRGSRSGRRRSTRARSSPSRTPSVAA